MHGGMEVVPEEQERLRPRLTRLGCGLAVVGMVAMALSTSTAGECSREQLPGAAAQLVAEKHHCVIGRV